MFLSNLLNYIKEFYITPLYFVGLLGYTWQCGMKYTDNKLEIIKMQN